MASEPAGEPLSAVEKVVRVLDALPTERRVSSIRQVAGLSLSTTHRILAELIAVGWVRQDPDRGYVPDSGLLSLAGRLLTDVGHPERVRRALQQLADASGLTVHLGVRQGDQAVYTEKLDGPGAYRLRSYIGQAVHLHSTALGKAVLAGLDETEVDAIAGRTGLPALTSATITTPSRLREALDQVRNQGWAYDAGENEEHTRCLGVAVRDNRGVPVAGVSVAGLAHDLGPERAVDLVELVDGAAREVSRAFGAVVG
ncbi:IclR family transcriptional regulator [Micromonospora sp. NPDC049900]|uniref:IclR family transcriptional regulator n=1 Tax=unclassified Micromonospora TaxID=2617518 RepID=UPI0037895316